MQYGRVRPKAQGNSPTVQPSCPKTSASPLLSQCAVRSERIAADADVAATLFDILEVQKLIEGEARITLVSAFAGPMARWLAANPSAGGLVLLELTFPPSPLVVEPMPSDCADPES
jgi:hypothetical protein